VRIARKEAKETRYWLRLMETGGAVEAERERDVLIQEATELMRILGAILQKFLPGGPK
jgi:four helix bundle protein